MRKPKAFFIIAILLILSLPLFSTDYYVSQDDGNDAYNGLYPTFQGGLDGPWLTINKVNISAFNPGDIIDFNKGNSWREQLTVPSSGSLGNPITFGAYGSGAAPIINGSNLVATWTEYNTAIIDQSVNDDYWNVQTNTCQKLKIASSYKVKKVSVLMYQSGGAANAHIEFWTEGTSNAGATMSGDSTQIGGDSAAVSISSADSNGVWYDFTWSSNYPDLTADCFMHIVPAAGTLYIRSTVTETSYEDTNYDLWRGGAEIAGDNDLTFKVYPHPDVWQATLTTEPGDVVLFDNEMGQEESSLAALTALKEWYWASNVLYVYSTSDPDTAYTSPGVEAAQRNQGIEINAKNYITIDGLTVKGADDYGILFYGGGTNCIIKNSTIKLNYFGVSDWTDTDYYTVQDCTVEYNGGSGIKLGNGGNHQTISGNTVRYNGQDTSTGANTESGITGYINNCTISNNTVHNNCYSTQKGQGHGIYVICPSGSSGNSIYGNTCYSNRNGSGIKLTEITSINCYGNKCYGNYGGGITLTAIGTYTGTISVYYNICYSNNIGFYQYGSAATGTSTLNLYNNVFYQNNDTEASVTVCDIRFYNDIVAAGTATIKNNIVHGDDSNSEWYLVAQTGTFNIDNNCTRYGDFYYDGAARNWAYWQGTLGFDANGLNSDPLFVDAANGNFHLNPHSPCVNKGTNVNLVEDYEGKKVRHAPDIGAYEDQTNVLFMGMGFSPLIPFLLVLFAIIAYRKRRI